ncbi:hypothetical protein G4228_018518 [Cervus hanglu yarkandensis]|nr:hypothetical protein G4228_018518 [Cervus hanglu yarkandensis]
MSSQESPGVESSTTTVSSVAVQAGDSKIVIAVIKCGKWVQLQLAESQPNLLEIGSNQDETKKLLHDHELLLAKLKALEDRVWELLQEADRTAEENNDQRPVYDAMAETLGEAWAALVSMLERRRELLRLTSEFFENALEFAIKIDQAEEFLQNTQEFESAESLKSLLQLHEHHTKGKNYLACSYHCCLFVSLELLERSLALLNKSQQLTDFIEKIKCDGPNVSAEMIQGAQNSCLKIDSLLELLQDRRRQLDKYLKQQQQELSQVLRMCQWDQQESQVTCWFQKTIRDLEEQGLGTSLSDNEELIRKHEELIIKAKEWNAVVETLKREALGLLLSKQYVENEHLQLSNQKLNQLQEEFGQLMAERKGWLKKANEFFNSANKVEMSIQKISTVLFNAMDIGSNLSESEKILSKYLELDKQAKETSHELEAAAKLLTEKHDFELDELASLSSKAKWLEEELNILGQSINSRSQVLQTYVAFLKSSEEVEKQCQGLKEFYQTDILRKEEGGAEAKHWSDSVEKQWQLFLKRSFLTHDLGLEFLNLINMAKENEILNVKNEVHVMENTMESQKAEREELSRLRTAWQLKAAASKPMKQQWAAFKEQLRKQLNDEVQYIIKESEELNGKGAPVKEKSQQLKDLIHFHQNQKQRIRDYEDILYKIIQFHQVREENCSNISAKNLQQQLDILEGDCLTWRAQAEDHERALTRSLEFCITRDEISELKESFKEIKKKFNNLKFNYTKKNEKARNLKALKYQIQQVDMYAEKLQALKRKMEKVENKTSFLNYPNNKENILLEAMRDLQKHVDEFDKVVTDYRKNLDLTEHLQELIEECHFWYEDASATVVRVGKYSAECKTKAAVEILHQQFKKFITPAVPQQEERIQEISDLAQRLYGFEEGQKYAEKIVAKHKEVLESITELCSFLTELEEKLKQGDVLKLNLNLEDFHDDCVDLLKEPARNKQTIFNDGRNKEQAQPAAILAVNGARKGQLPQGVKQLVPGKESAVQGLLLPGDVLSGEEYECASPDDISLPPVPGSPDSLLAPSDMELEARGSPFPRHHLSGHGMQTGASGPGEAPESGFPPPAAFADACNDKRETFSSHFEKPSPQVQAEPPLTSQGFLEKSTAFHKIRAQLPESMRSEVHDRASQQHPQAQGHLLERPEKMHADNNVTKTRNRLHASQDAFSGLGFHPGPSQACQRQMVPREEIISTPAKNSMVSLAGQAPNFSRLLSNVTVMEGSPVTLEVEVTGFPEPTLTWYKKGQKLSADGHLQVLHKETRHLVFIPKVCEADAGLYVARAQNPSGILSSSVNLHVTGNHKPPITRINWIMLCVIYVTVSLMYWLFTQ